MKRLILEDGLVVTMDREERVLRGWSVVIEGGKFQQIAPKGRIKKADGDRVESMEGKVILPGLINSHVHTVQQLARGLADDVDILTWLHGRIWPYESSLKPEESYLATLLCGVEQIRNGVTSMADAGIHHSEATVRAVEELGLRASLCYSIMDMGEGLPSAWRWSVQRCVEEQEAAYRQFHGAAGGKVEWWLGLRTLMNNSDELVRATVALADRLGTKVHMHVAEAWQEKEIIGKRTGTTTVRHLDRLGLLGPGLLAVHCVYLDAEEMSLMAERGVKVSHNPAAALRVMGLPPVVELREAGVTVSIATDGAPSNCRNSLIDEMFLAALVQKGRCRNPEVMPATEVLKMVTIDAARCLGWEDRVGSIEVGKEADLCVIQPATVNMVPNHDPISNLVFSMKTRNVEGTMVGGRWLMRGGRLVRGSEQAWIEEAERLAPIIRRRAGIRLPDRMLKKKAA
ncbi:MAG: amidohydrolase [Verrucomicrobiia bacterium]